MHHSLLGLSLPGWISLLVLAVVLLLLVSNRFRIDMIAFFIFAALGICRVLDEKQLFAGFGNEAVVVIASMLAIGEGLVRSGITDAVSSRITELAGNRENRLLLTLISVGGLLSSIIGDLPIVSIFMPIILGFEKRFNVRAQRLLLPFAIASTLGGLITMVGSSTNIVTNELLAQSGLPRLPLFSIAPLGLIFLIVGVLIMWPLSRFLPNHSSLAKSLKNNVGVPEYLTELHVSKDSSWIGHPLENILFLKENGINVVRILRKIPVDFPTADTVLLENDVLLVQAHVDDLLNLRNTKDFSVHSGVSKSLEEAKVEMAGEVIIRQDSNFIGRTLDDLSFRKAYHVTVLALWRNGRVMTQRLACIRLQTGDMLLLQGPSEKIKEIADDKGLIMISQRQHAPNSRRKGPLALGVLAMILLLVSLRILPMSIAGVIGVGLMVCTGILSPGQVFRAVEWPILMFVSAMFALGTALKNTGMIDLVSRTIVHVVGPMGPYVMLAVCFILAALLTQVLSNTTTTLLLTPVMIAAAKSLEISPIPLVIAVMVGVTAAPLTYVSHKVFLLIMGPGGYRYFDYLRFGWPLTIVFFGLTMGLVPFLWPF